MKIRDSPALQMRLRRITGSGIATILMRGIGLSRRLEEIIVSDI